MVSPLAATKCLFEAGDAVAHACVQRVTCLDRIGATRNQAAFHVAK